MFRKVKLKSSCLKDVLKQFIKQTLTDYSKRLNKVSPQTIYNTQHKII